MLWWIVSVLLIIAMRDQVIVGVSLSPQSHIYLPEFGNLAVVIGIPNYIFLVYAIVLLYLGWRHSSSALDRTRVRYLWVGLILVVLGTLANFVPLLKPYPIDGVTNVINALLIAYAIFRYQLLDISVVIRKGLLYSVPTVAVGIAYFLAISLAMNLLHMSMDPQIFLALPGYGSRRFAAGAAGASTGCNRTWTGCFSARTTTRGRCSKG